MWLPIGNKVIEIRVFARMLLSYDNVVYVDGRGNEDGGGIHVVYFGPFVFALHYLGNETSV